MRLNKEKMYGKKEHEVLVEKCSIMPCWYSILVGAKIKVIDWDEYQYLSVRTSDSILKSDCSIVAPYEKILGLSEPYSLRDVLKYLVDASEYLLHEKSYDGDDYEEIGICVQRAKEIMETLSKVQTI